jgi:hypothetical protein
LQITFRIKEVQQKSAALSLLIGNDLRFHILYSPRLEKQDGFASFPILFRGETGNTSGGNKKGGLLCSFLVE